MYVAAAGLSPISPVMWVVPVVEIPDFARITKFPAIPRSTGCGPAANAVTVLKFHTLLLASAFPARSLAPVVIVAVYSVPATRLLVGVKVATRPT